MNRLDPLSWLTTLAALIGAVPVVGVLAPSPDRLEFNAPFPPFTMIYTIEHPDYARHMIGTDAPPTTMTGKLEYRSNIDWKLTILADEADAEHAGSWSARKGNTFTTYDPLGSPALAVEQLDDDTPGGLASVLFADPAQMDGFVEVPSAPGTHRYRRESIEPCKGVGSSATESADGTTVTESPPAEDFEAVVEVTVDAATRIPLSYVSTCDGATWLRFTVIDLQRGPAFHPPW